MANYTNIFRKDGEITLLEMVDVFRDINKEVFNNTLTYDFKSNGDIEILGEEGLYWWKNDKPFIDYVDTGEEDMYDEVKVSVNNYEMRSVPRKEHLRWINIILEYEVVNRLDLKITDEGIGYFEPKLDELSKTFKEFVAQSWFYNEDGWLMKFMKNQFAKRAYKDYYEQAQEHLPKEFFYEMFSEAKIRNEKIDELLDDRKE